MSAILAAAAVAISGAAASSFAPVRGTFRAALALPFGMGIWSAGYSVTLFAFGADPRVRLAKDALLVAAGTVFLVWRPRRAAVAADAVGPGSRDAPRWPAYAVAAAAVLATALLAEHTFRYPDGGWDAWAIWNLRARFLARGGEGFRAAFSPEILFWAHRDYPLLIPGAVAQAFLLVRSESPWVPAAISYAFAAAAVALLGAAARELRGSGWGALAALALLSTPCFVGFAANQQADVPIGALLLAACALTAIAVESGQLRALLPAGFAASLAAWTKNEGALYLSCLALALLATRWAPARDRVRGLLRFGLGALPVLALVAWFKLRIAHESDLFGGASASRIFDAGRWSELLAVLPRRIVYFQDWALWLFAEVAVLAILLPRLPRRPAARAIGTAVALALAVTMAVYVLQPHPLLWFFRASIDRVLIQLWPSALLATVLLLAPQPGVRGSPSSGAAADAAGASPSPHTSANDR